MPEQLSMLPALDAAIQPFPDAAANVRASDPLTSFQAARAAREFARGQCVDILEALRRHGPQSKDQIAARLNITGHACGKRLPDLQKAGMAVPTDQVRRSASGRLERVWRCV